MAPLLLLLVVLNKKKLSSFRLTLKEEKDMKLTFHEKKNETSKLYRSFWHETCQLID